GGAFLDFPWYTYNVMGTHDVSANQRVYALKNPEDIYKVQILSYYDVNGVSGMIQVRYANTESGSIHEIEVDARAGGFGADQDDPENRYQYLDLSSGTLLDISPEDAELSTD